MTSRGYRAAELSSGDVCVGKQRAPIVFPQCVIYTWSLSHGEEEPLPAAVNGCRGDRGPPKCLTPQAAGSGVGGRLTSDLQKWLHDWQ